MDSKIEEPAGLEAMRTTQLKRVQAEALSLFIRKNTDYGDAFAQFGVIGVLMRIEDKLQRGMSISKSRVALVSDEGMRDTLLDLHNYAAMAVMLLDEKDSDNNRVNEKKEDDSSEQK